MDDSPALPDHRSLFRPPERLAERLLSPLSLAAYVAWLAVALEVLEAGALAAGDLREWAGAATLCAVLLLFVLRTAREGTSDHAGAAWNTLCQGALTVATEALLMEGQTSILLIVVAGQLVLLMPIRQVLAWLAAFNLGFLALWMLLIGAPGAAALSLLPVMAFQAFAGLVGYYAGMSDRQREHLAAVNAELLATRELLEESARGGERLKLSRELHDVAGHKLTALKLNLARLARDPAFAGREELATSSQLADELLADIRAVVSQLRAHDGLDLRAALVALARPIPGTRIEVAVAPGLRVEGMAEAEALLRCAQEGITNAVRHGRAASITVHVRRRGGTIELVVENDGEAPVRLQPGNGLTGMRERLEALGGSLAFEPVQPHGLRLLASVPAGAA